MTHIYPIHKNSTLDLKYINHNFDDFLGHVYIGFLKKKKKNPFWHDFHNHLK